MRELEGCRHTQPERQRGLFVSGSSRNWARKRREPEKWVRDASVTTRQGRENCCGITNLCVMGWSRLEGPIRIRGYGKRRNKKCFRCAETPGLLVAALLTRPGRTTRQSTGVALPASAGAPLSASLSRWQTKGGAPPEPRLRGASQPMDSSMRPPKYSRAPRLSDAYAKSET